MLPEHCFRFLKQQLGWTRPLLRDPAAAERWTWLVIAAYAQLYLARPLAEDLRLPWQQPCPPGRLTPAGAALAGSRTYGPWGAVTATGGALAGSLGYQSQYTSPATGQVDMGARWYSPAAGRFGNKDTAANNPVPDSASASPYGYAADSPLDLADPTGHMLVIPTEATQAVRPSRNPPPGPPPGPSWTPTSCTWPTWPTSPPPARPPRPPRSRNPPPPPRNPTTAPWSAPRAGETS